MQMSKEDEGRGYTDVIQHLILRISFILIICRTLLETKAPRDRDRGDFWIFLKGGETLGVRESWRGED